MLLHGVLCARVRLSFPCASSLRIGAFPPRRRTNRVLECGGLIGTVWYGYPPNLLYLANRNKAQDGPHVQAAVFHPRLITFATQLFPATRRKPYLITRPFFFRR